MPCGRKGPDEPPAGRGGAELLPLHRHGAENRVEVRFAKFIDEALDAEGGGDGDLDAAKDVVDLDSLGEDLADLPPSAQSGVEIPAIAIEAIQRFADRVERIA
ncbi:MAG: hypothetical protein RML12_03925 [Xanthomonadales bacterium]|nr:hypothetical protein [Xanthomonadales bacterium]